jgi:hypothetical protein
LNGKHLNGKHLNGHDGKTISAGIVVKAGISAKARGKQGDEARVSA